MGRWTVLSHILFHDSFSFLSVHVSFTGFLRGKNNLKYTLKQNKICSRKVSFLLFNFLNIRDQLNGFTLYFDF